MSERAAGTGTNIPSRHADLTYCGAQAGRDKEGGAQWLTYGAPIRRSIAFGATRISWRWHREERGLDHRGGAVGARDDWIVLVGPEASHLVCFGVPLEIECDGDWFTPAPTDCHTHCVGTWGGGDGKSRAPLWPPNEVRESHRTGDPRIQDPYNLRSQQQVMDAVST